MAMHDGHRDRMRERILNNGLSALQEHEILEYLLYSCILRKDTNELAHNLIDEFGSLQEVLDAQAERLEQIKGISRNTAIYLSSLSELFRIYGYKKSKSDVVLNTTRKCVDYIRPIIATLKKEEIHMLLKDSAGKLIKRVLVSKGVVNESSCYVREITDIALKNEATSVVLVHNHPSNIASPSLADKEITEQVALALTLIGIALDDHLIITVNGYYSFRSSGLLDKINNGNIKLSNGRIKDIQY